MIWKNILLNSCGIKICVKDIRGFSRAVPACAVNFGALRGSFEKNFAPLEGVADKQQSGGNRHCLQGRFVERLAWETGEGFPLLKFAFF